VTIYPTGDINDYVDGFYRPYEEFRGPIYAVPGNHDWYDGLEGFMFHFCGAEPLAPTAHRKSSYRFAERVAQRIWRRSSRPDRATLYRYGRHRQTLGESGRARLQPGPYYALKTERLLLVCIDTGVTGGLDAEQGDWLLDVAALPGPKVLLTGKPIYVDGDYHAGAIDWGPRPKLSPGTSEARRRSDAFPDVDSIVRHPTHDFVAAIGGDVHNYQRYRVQVGNAADATQQTADVGHRTIEYVVSGGGGAYLSATHRIGRVNMPASAERETWHGPSVDAVGEDQFCCYPLRGDSLALFTRGFGKILGRAFLVVWPVCIALLVAGRLWWWERPIGGHADMPSAGCVALIAVVFVFVLACVLVAGFVGGAKLSAVVNPDPEIPTIGVLRFASVVALGAAAVLGVEALPGDAWPWLWRIALVTTAIIVLPVTLIVVRYYGRGVGPAVTRDIVRAGVPAAACIVVVAPAGVLGIGGTVVVTTVVVAVLALFSVTLRRQFRRAYPLALTIGAVLSTVAAIVWLLLEGRWYAEITVAASAGLWLAISLAAGVLAYPAALMPWRFAWGRMDPDAAIVEFAAHIKSTATERATSKTPSTTDAWRAKLLLGRMGSVLNTFVSEVAEASTAPFFKSLLTVQTTDDKVNVECWGVSGFDGVPTLEDRFEIILAPRPKTAAVDIP
jgi:hypothetical protein